MLAALLTVLAIAVLAPAQTLAQTEASMEPPRTPWGAPDLQGVWDFRSLTPMERPEELADTENFTAEQAAEFAEETIRTAQPRQRHVRPRRPLQRLLVR